MTIIIQSRPSNGAFLLAQALRAAGQSVLRRSASSTSRLRRSSFLVNWGMSTGSAVPHLNSYVGTAAAINKLAAFNALQRQHVRVPENTRTAEATNESQDIWLARQSLSGSGGRGIVVVRPGEVFPDAKVYVKYVPKLLEFRVHVFRILNEENHIEARVLTRQKLRSSSAEQTRDQRLIRNHDNGWVFGLVREQEAANKAAAEAEAATAALGLDFTAVDVIIGRDDGLPYILELNTAPGLEAEPVVEFYRDNIVDSYNNWRYNGL